MGEGLTGVAARAEVAMGAEMGSSVIDEAEESHASVSGVMAATPATAGVTRSTGDATLSAADPARGPGLGQELRVLPPLEQNVFIIVDDGAAEGGDGRAREFHVYV